MSRLEDLLQQCTVKIIVPGGWGTGFFVASGLILTCAHVVQRSPQKVQVEWQNQTFAAVVERTFPDPYDVALLRVKLSAEVNPPCVCLDKEVQSRDPLYLFGYPDEGDLQGEPRTFNCDGITGSDIASILFNLGQVRPGMSGSPLLNQRTGKVCGMVKFTRDRSSDLGGGAIPTRVFFERFPELQELQQKFHGTDKRWSNIDQENVLPISDLVAKVKRDYHKVIKQQWEKIRFAFGNKCVNIQDVYVDVYILEKPLHNTHLDRSDVLRERNILRDLNRFGLTERVKRISGHQAVIDIQKMMVFGKPGSGKTTFLQHIAFECIEGKLLPDHIPVLVSLRDLNFHSTENKEFIFDITNQVFLSLKSVASKHEVLTLLESGRVLLILDGLDEIGSSGLDENAGNRAKVISSIEDFIKKYYDNRVIVSCRIQSQEYQIKSFDVDVEIADFNSDQIQNFAKNYFMTVYDDATLAQEKAKVFFNILNLPENQPIRELATTPILLSLVCISFKDRDKDEFLTRARLYKEGVRLLLRKWDQERGLISIRSSRKDFELNDREALLESIAFRKSHEKEQFILFEEKEILGYIRDYFRSSKQKELSEEEARNILDIVVEQHGLIVERANSIYSFSHLTFQEYFTASKIVKEQDWKNLIEHITWGHWQEVFRLSFSLADPCDNLLWELKNHIDLMVADDPMIQDFLQWVHSKAMSAPDSPYKMAVIRLFYFIRAFNMDVARILGRWENLKIYQALEKDLNCDRSFALVQEFHYTRSIKESELNFGIELGRFLHYAEYIEPDFAMNIRQFRDEFPSIDNEDNFRQEWEVKGESWNNRVKQIMLDNSFYPRSQLFSNEQVELLRQYYKRNELLVKCLNSDCAVSDETRAKVEATLLLPLAELD